jgi:hypothetical protein
MWGCNDSSRGSSTQQLSNRGVSVYQPAEGSAVNAWVVELSFALYSRSSWVRNVSLALPVLGAQQQGP